MIGLFKIFGGVCVGLCVGTAWLAGFREGDTLLIVSGTIAFAHMVIEAVEAFGRLTQELK